MMHIKKCIISFAKSKLASDVITSDAHGLIEEHHISWLQSISKFDVSQNRCNQLAAQYLIAFFFDLIQSCIKL